MKYEIWNEKNDETNHCIVVFCNKGKRRKYMYRVHTHSCMPYSLWKDGEREREEE